MRLNNYHACLFIESFRVNLVSIVINLEMEKVFLVEIPDNSNKVTLFDPQFDGPAPPQGHLEQDGAINEACEDRLPILIHRWTQLKVHHGGVVWLTLVKLDFEQLIDKTLLLRIVTVDLFLVVGPRRRFIDHLIKEARGDLANPVLFVIIVGCHCLILGTGGYLRLYNFFPFGLLNGLNPGWGFRLILLCILLIGSPSFTGRACSCDHTFESARCDLLLLMSGFYSL